MNRIITISREYGAGGHSIGRRVAEELGIPFYDRDIVKQTVKASGYDLDMVEHDEEDVTRTGFFLKSLCSVSDASFSDTQDAIHEVQSTVILHLAKEGPCVILGRCADEILRKADIKSMNVFIRADAAHGQRGCGSSPAAPTRRKFRKSSHGGTRAATPITPTTPAKSGVTAGTMTLCWTAARWAMTSASGSLPRPHGRNN